MASTSSPYHGLSFSLFSTICKSADCQFFSSVLVHLCLSSFPDKIWITAFISAHLHCSSSLPYSLACFRAPDVHVHLTRARTTSAVPHGGSPNCLVLLFTRLSFLPFSPLCVSKYLGDLVSLQPPPLPPFIWVLPPPAPPLPWNVAAPMPWSSLLCKSRFPTSLSAARVCWFSPFQYSA